MSIDAMSRHSLVVSVVGVSLALLSTPCRADEDDGVGAAGLGYVQVADGGHEVAGLEEGILYSASFDAACEPLATDTSTEPAFAGTVSGHVGLDVTLSSCRRSSAPRTTCSWSVEPVTLDASCRESSARSSGTASWTGWSQRIDVELPDQTGVYEWSLTCDLGDGVEQTARSAVYVTLGKPLVPFVPPEPEWFARSTCWAGGFGVDADESEVLDALLAGLYAYGGLNWRYGYADQLEGRYLFALEKSDAGRQSVEYVFEGETPDFSCYDAADPPFCKCPWQELVDSGAVCDFADCYAFSDVLQATAGVLGVGGLMPIMIQGDGNRGFVTRSAPSLDPKFAGNVQPEDEACEAEGSCPSQYYFGTHSLRVRDGRFLDATFGKVYDRPEAPVLTSRVAGEYSETLTLEGDRRLVAVGEGYGGWMWFAQEDGDSSDDSSNESSSSAAAGAGGADDPPVRFTENAFFETSTITDSDPAARRLTGEVEVEIRRAGQYLAEARLEDRDGELVATRASWLSSRPAGTLLEGEVGSEILSLSFSGEEIYRSRLDGPYRVVVTISERGRVVADSSFETDDYEHEDFGQVDGILHDAEPVAESMSGSAAPTFAVTFEARRTGFLALDLRLAEVDEAGEAAGGRTLAYGGWSDEVFRGHHRVEVSLDDVRRAGTGGARQLTLILYDEKLVAIDHLRINLEEPSR